MSMLAQAKHNWKTLWGHGDDDYDSEDDDFDGGDQPAQTSHSSSSSAPKYSDHKYTDKYSSHTSSYTPSYGGGGGSSSTTRARNLRSVPIPLRAREKNIYTLRPRTQDEAAIAADYLKAGSAVVVNLESVEREVAVRIIDFMSGVCYGLEGQGHAMKLGDLIFLFTPGEFEISSDELDYGENRDFFFKEISGHGAAQTAAVAPQRMSTPAVSTPSAPAGNAYTSSFANSYNTPQQQVAPPQNAGGMSGSMAASAQIPNTQSGVAQSTPQASVQPQSPRAQTVPASSVYGTSGKAHVTIGGRVAPTTSLSPAPRPASNVSRSWER